MNGCDVDSIYLSKETEAALKGLKDYEAHFVLQKVREGIASDLSYQLKQWYEQELESPACDMAKVARRAEACRLLSAIAEAKAY